MVVQLGFARSPVAGKRRSSYEDALQSARAELERQA
jgi:hypothetical protein